jgi:hypothetical protein
MSSMAAPIQTGAAMEHFPQRLTALLNQCPQGEQMANMINCHRGTKGLHRRCPRSERHRAPARRDGGDPLRSGRSGARHGAWSRLGRRHWNRVDDSHREGPKPRDHPYRQSPGFSKLAEQRLQKPGRYGVEDKVAGDAKNAQTIIIIIRRFNGMGRRFAAGAQH